MPKTPAEIVREEVRALKAYHVPENAGMVKLDAMENPYRLPPELRGRLARLVEEAALNRYPDAGAQPLKDELRRAFELPGGVELLLGNGSDELIQMLIMAVAKPGAVVLGVEPSFVMFRLIATFAGARYVGVDLREDYTLDAERPRELLEEPGACRRGGGPSPDRAAASRPRQIGGDHRPLRRERADHVHPGPGARGHRMDEQMGRSVALGAALPRWTQGHQQDRLSRAGRVLR